MGRLGNWLSGGSLFSRLFGFLFLLFLFGFSFGVFKAKFFQGLFELFKFVFLFILLFLLLRDLFFGGFWLLWLGLGGLLLGLLLFLALFVSHVEWVSDCVQVEFSLLKLFGFKTTFDSFHVTETSSQMFLRVEGLDFGFSLLLLLRLFLSLGLLLWALLSWLFFLVIWLLFFRFWVLLVAGNISPKACLWNNRNILLLSWRFLAYSVDMIAFWDGTK